MERWGWMERRADGRFAWAGRERGRVWSGEAAAGEAEEGEEKAREDYVWSMLTPVVEQETGSAWRCPSVLQGLRRRVVMRRWRQGGGGGRG